MPSIQVRSTIGGFAGAIVGSFFGMPQLGFMIGSAIGGYLDPQRIEGPRLKDASVQTSQDGVPIPFGYGVFPCAGNVIWRDKLVEQIDLREELIAYYQRRGYRRTGVHKPFPYGDERFGIPHRPDLRFEVLEKPLREVVA